MLHIILHSNKYFNFKQKPRIEKILMDLIFELKYIILHDGTPSHETSILRVIISS